MNSIYNSELHKFVEGYFNVLGASIEEIYNDSFIVLFPDGKRERYTYIPRVAGENKDVKLLAKGSRSLREFVQQCTLKAAFSSVKVSYSTHSTALALRQKSCCDLCPFITICQNTGTCCDFCNNFKNCNTRIENAEFSHLGETIETKPLDIICFIFTVELSNDYSLSQKIEKNITVLIDLNTNQILGSVLAKDLVNLDMEPMERNPLLNSDSYPGYLKIARQEAENVLKEQLDVFKKEIEGPLKDKITAIINKFEEDYVENYTKTTIENLELMQADALKLCEREIRGYTINSSFHLKNVIVLKCSRDVREMIFKLKQDQKELSVRGEIFLSRIDIKCSQCGIEIDKGVLCENGHVLCRNCSEICCICGKINCNMCDNETYLCATCGEPVCSNCSVKCSSCNIVLCSNHGYKCNVCNNLYCLDCHEICNICDTNICNTHVARCSECDEPACPDHTNQCSICQKAFCEDHTNICVICESKLCEEHSNFSAYSNRTTCDSHKAFCSVCEDIFAIDEVKNCTQCNDQLCPAHVKYCSKCGKVYCSKHINHCRGCGSDVCSCTSFTRCKLCGEEFCSHCVDSKGYCTACSSITRIEIEHNLVRLAIQALPALEKYNKFFLGKSREITVLYAKGFLTNVVIVFSLNNELINYKTVGFVEDFIRKINKKPQH